MTKISLFEALYMSFYSKRLYREVATSWGGYAILYLFMLVTLSWIGATWRLQDSISLAYKKYAYDVTTQIPVITIDDGKLSTPLKRPYLIFDPYNLNNLIAVVDTTGKYKNLDGSMASILVTNEKIIMRKMNKAETRTYQIPDDYSRIIYPSKINNFLYRVVGYAWIPIFIGCVLFSFVYRLIQAYIYGLIGLGFNYFYNGKLTYGQITQIAMIAVTPAVIISTIYHFLGVHFKHQLFLYFSLSLLYLFYGIVANSKTEKKDGA